MMGGGMDWDEQRLGRHLKLRDLNVLFAVTRCGSMGKAAAQLAVSQPAISKSIADMELTLGVRLLDRTPRGVEPTIYARVLLDRGLIAFDELRQAIKHIEHLADPSKGEVRIGSSNVLAENFVASVVDRLSRRSPGFTFHLLARESGAIYRALEERKVDLAILRLFKPLAETYVTTEVLYDDPHVVAAGMQNPWIGRRAIRLADLISEPWVLPPLDSLTGLVVVEFFRASGLEVPAAAIVTDSTPVRRTLLASGRFLSIVPASLLKGAPGKPPLKALPIRLPTASSPIAIVTLKDRTLSPAAEIFIKTAREVAKRQ
jgi:DNA-binding transcriptional LysR family regulator